MPEQPTHLREPAAVGPSTDDWLKSIPAALVVALTAPLTLFGQGRAAGFCVLAFEMLAGAALLVYASGLRVGRAEAKHRASTFTWVAITACCLALLALVLLLALPAGNPTKVFPAQPPPADKTSRVPRVLPNTVYVDPGNIDPRYLPSLIQALHGRALQVTGDPARAAVALRVSIAVTSRQNLSVGGMNTWQATCTATLQAVATNGDKPIFENAQQSHAVAMQADHAEENAVADALLKVVEDYNATVKREGIKT